MNVISKLEAPTALVGTAKSKNLPIRWNRPGLTPALVYPSGQVVPFALESERETAISNWKGWEETQAGVRAFAHVQRQSMERVVAKNVHKVTASIMRSIRK